MSNVNVFQVQRTNNVSTASKCSAASKSYFQDVFIEEFAGKPKVRSPLIHLGYYTRAEILNKLINDYIMFLDFQKVLEFQIVSCGSGFDTTFWRLSQLNLLHDKSVLIEIDFPSVIQQKILQIKQSEKLKSYLNKMVDPHPSSKVHKLSSNYYLLEADLSSLLLIEELFCEIMINFEIPTLFLSECAITYMTDQDSDNLIKWVAKKFKNSCFINYEQIHPFDAFGQIMISHFQKLQSPLLSVFKYPDCKSHMARYKNLGFQRTFAISEWEALIWLTAEEQRKKAFSLEVFDELEEFHLKCAHYVIAFAGSGISSSWVDSCSSQALNVPNEIDSRPKLCCENVKNSLKLYKHCSCIVKNACFLFGGSNGQNRSSQIYKYTSGNLGLQLIKESDSIDIKLDLVYGTVTYFEINKVPFVCLYGGRTSPDKIWNNGLPAVFELVEGDKFELRSTVIEGYPIPRYRTTMVSLNSNEMESEFWMFGGRTPDIKNFLSDLWQLVINHGGEKILSCKWKQLKRKCKLWPCARMSHSFTACPKRSELFLIGGLKSDLSCVLNDMWMWSCKTESWEKIELVGQLLPRYGHTSHLKDSVIYLVGGVNTMGDKQPGLATISLMNLMVTEYALQLLSPSSLLFNHISTILDNCELEIIGGGGQCFSFGSHFNEEIIRLRIDQLRDDNSASSAVTNNFVK